MIFDSIEKAEFYYNLSIHLKKGLLFLKNTPNLHELPIGRIEIDGDNVFALVQEYETKDFNEDMWEAHKEYFDIQFMVSGTEEIKISRIEDMTPNTAYHPDGDYWLFSGQGNGLIITNNQNDDDYIWTCKIIGFDKGFHSIELFPTHIPKKIIGLGNLHYLKLSVKPHGHIIRERWRPNAAHSYFYSSETKNIDAWAISISKELPSLHSYNPFITPFGYYGISTDKDGYAGNVNFSLWSYKKNDPPPATYKLSRIIAIGHPTAEFGHFSHEGTGVKIRDFDDLWNSNTSKEYVFALRMVHDKQSYNDGQLNIFYSYYWDEGLEKWKLYGVAKKFNKGSNLDTLETGAFVEVTGASTKERSCQAERKLFYRGYVRDKSYKTWRLIDEMKGLLNGDAIRNKSWGQDDGYFYMSAGGLVQNDLTPFKDKIKLSTEDEGSEPQQPKYINKIHQIDEELPFPTIISHEATDTQLSLNINIPDKNKNNNKIVVYYGDEDGLSIDNMWQHKKTFYNKSNGNHELNINVKKKPTYCRVLVKDDELQIFNLYTIKIN